MRQPDHTVGQLEFAYVLFMDIVSYSLLPMDYQSEVIQQLQDIVRDLPDVRSALDADELICLPAGDGMALVFFGDPTAPLRCAREIVLALRQNSKFELRMGVHIGPVYRLADVNTNRNVAGGGINFAQRVMDCGDGGHILVSKAVADVLLQLSNWKGAIHDLGEHEVKHGVRVHLFNVFTEEFGNPQTPSKLAHPKQELAVYVATTTSNLNQQRKAVIQQLNAWGYPVMPREALPVESGDFRSTVESTVAECSFSVHLMSGQRGMIPEGEDQSVIALQYEIAQSHRLERVVWLSPGTQLHPTLQASLNEGSQEGLERLEGQTIEDLKDIVESKLKRLQGETLSLKAVGGRPSVYLVCDNVDNPHVDELPHNGDSTHRERALELEGYLNSKGFIVWLPPAHVREKKRRDKDHWETLKLSDAVVLYWGAADEGWFRENLRAVTKARTTRSSRPFSAEAIYFSSPQRTEKSQYKNYLELAFEQFEEFRPEALKPLIQRLKPSSQAAQS